MIKNERSLTRQEIMYSYNVLHLGYADKADLIENFISNCDYTAELDPNAQNCVHILHALILVDKYDDEIWISMLQKLLTFDLTFL